MQLASIPALRIISILFIVFGLYLLVSAKPAATGTIKIGFLAPLTGDAAVYGEPARNVTQLAVDEINADGGVDGQRIEVVYEDGKCNGRDAASAMQKLTTVDRVKVVIGGFCSSESLAAVPIAEENETILFSPGSSSPDLTGKSRFFARDYPSDASQGSVLAEISANDMGWKKVGFIQEQLDYPLGIYRAFTKVFEANGGSTVKEEFPTATTDFRSQITKLRSNSPDAVFVDTQTPAAAERILRQMQELGWKPPILVSDVVPGSPETLQQNAGLLDGALAAEFGVDNTNTKFKHLLDAYKQKFNQDLPYQSYGQTEYDAVYMVRDALKTVGNDGGKIADWLRGTKDWEGASGGITIGADGDRASGFVPKIIRSGKSELYIKSTPTQVQSF